MQAVRHVRSGSDTVHGYAFIGFGDVLGHSYPIKG